MLCRGSFSALFGRTFVRLLSDYCRTFVRPLSDFFLFPAPAAGAGFHDLHACCRAGSLPGILLRCPDGFLACCPCGSSPPAAALVLLLLPDLSPWTAARWRLSALCPLLPSLVCSPPCFACYCPACCPRWSSSCCTAAALGFFPDGLSSRSPRWTARLPGVAVLRLCGLLPDLSPVPCWLLLPGQIFSSCCTLRDLLRMDGAPSPPASLDGSAVSLRSAARTPPQSFRQGSARRSPAGAGATMCDCLDSWTGIRPDVATVSRCRPPRIAAALPRDPARSSRRYTPP